MLFLLMFFFIYLLLILGIAFLTLWERHLLGLSQLRLGPNKVSFFGFIQALLDGLKLLKKENIFPLKSYLMMYFLVPVMMFFLLFLVWLVLPYLFFFLNFEFSLLFFFCCIGFSVYSVLLSGFFSNSSYSFIGSVRAGNQSISFEICFTFLFLGLFFSLNSFNILFFFSSAWFLFLPFFLFSSLTELNRAPFDLTEGESELVSGFNVEFSSVLFIFLFLSEYGMLIFFCCLLSLMYSFFSLFFFLLVFLFIRSCYPRLRYDFLMEFYWKKVLPVLLVLVLFSFNYFFY